MSDTPEQITAKVLSEHQRNEWGQHDGWWECACSSDQPFTPHHQAAMILAAQREAAAENNDLIRRADEALRRWENSGHAGDLHALPNIVFELIRALAAAEAAEGAQQ